jgi:CRP/FNR family transcriptional regulator, anaerobic regulatory protein
MQFQKWPNSIRYMEHLASLIDFLGSVYPLTDELKSYLTQTVKVKELTKKKFLLKAGHISSNICFIQKGLLRCFHVNNREEVSTWFMKEGDVIISVSSFYNQKISNEYIQPLEDCILCYVSYSELMHIYKEYIGFNFNGRILTEKYHTQWVDYTDAMRRKNARDRYQWMVNKFPELIQRVPSKYLASYLDMNEVTLSRIKGQPRRKKVIS